MQVSSLNLSPDQRHKLLLLAADFYDPVSDTVVLKCDKFQNQHRNAKWLSEIFYAMLAEAKVRFPHSSTPLDSLTYP